METEKVEQLSEKSPGFNSRDNEKEDSHDHESNPNSNSQENDQKNETIHDSATPEPETENTAADKEAEANAENYVVEEPAPPPPPDFSEVCQEIDRFISVASGTEGDAPDMQVVEQFAFLVQAKIANYDAGERQLKWSQLSDEESSDLLKAVDRVSKLATALSELSSQSKYFEAINHIGDILQRAMSYLEDQFRLVLEDRKVPDSDPNNGVQETDQPSTEEPNSTKENNFLGFPEDTVLELKKMAETMILGGHEAECFHVYFVARRAAFEETLQELGYEKLSFDEVQKMQWESLEREIETWKKTFKECMGVNLAREKNLSDAVFSEHARISENLSRCLMIQLLNFALAIVMTKRSPEKLFKFLDIYETLREATTTMENLFTEKIVNELKAEALVIRSRVGESMVCIFNELENSIKADTGKTPVPGGAVHPLTRYVMDYLTSACEYRETLEQVFREHQKIERADSATGSDFDGSAHGAPTSVPNLKNKQSSFAIQINKLMDSLDTNLETRSKLYRDPALNAIFMMNNGRYIMQKIRSCPQMNGLMGDPWTRKRSSELRQFHNTYKRETWGKLLQCLNQEGLSQNGKVVKPILKERFKSFNAQFDEIRKTQSTWVVCDEQLQSELQVSISAIVIPAYRSFLARYSQTFTPGRQVEKYIKFQPEDLETYIEELFDGNGAAQAGRRRP
ncbi:hypothetical protein NMG60_11026754 [Bertholletia excelsa]